MAECGCQAEVGSACAMAAAALGELFGLSIDKIEYASKIVENDNIGTIECGKTADLVLLDANPLDDLKNIRKVNIVVFEGEIVDEKWMCNLQ